MPPALRLKTIVPLFAVGALLAGCSAGPAAPSEQSSPSEGTLIPAPAPVGTTSADCPEAAARWAEGEPAEGFYDDLPAQATIVETNSGTILETVDSPRTDGTRQLPTTTEHVASDPSWPSDSVVIIDDSTDEVVETIHALHNMLCAP